MWTRSMNALVKSDGCAFQCLQRHRARDIGKSNKLLRPTKRECSHRAHCLRAVEKSETFLHFQLQRCNVGALKSGSCRNPFTLMKNFSFTDRC